MESYLYKLNPDLQSLLDDKLIVEHANALARKNAYIFSCYYNKVKVNKLVVIESKEDLVELINVIPEAYNQLAWFLFDNKLIKIYNSIFHSGIAGYYDKSMVIVEIALTFDTLEKIDDLLYERDQMTHKIINFELYKQFESNPIKYLVDQFTLEELIELFNNRNGNNRISLHPISAN